SQAAARQRSGHGGGAEAACGGGDAAVGVAAGARTDAQGAQDASLHGQRSRAAGNHGAVGGAGRLRRGPDPLRRVKSSHGAKISSVSNVSCTYTERPTVAGAGGDGCGNWEPWEPPSVDEHKLPFHSKARRSCQLASVR